MSSDAPEPAPRRRKIAIGVAVGFIALVVVVAIFAFLNIDDNPTGAALEPSQPTAVSTPTSADPTVSPSPSLSASESDSPPATTKAEPSSVPSPSIPKATATGKPTVVPTKATQSTTAPLDSKASLDNGVSVRVSKIESVKGEAQGPGEIAGPAVRITVEVTNGTNKRVPMDMSLVNLYYGKARTPASTLSGPGYDPLSKPIPAGESGSGKYVFSVPVKGRNPLTVEFSYTTDAPTVIFSGQ
jgi:cytoskeletal protein RodZ